MSETPKVDLKLLKQLVEELEHSLELGTKLHEGPKPNVDYIVEMSKASGLVSAVAQEATLLLLDIYAAISLNQGTLGTPKEDTLKSLMSLVKGGKTPNTN